MLHRSLVVVLSLAAMATAGSASAQQSMPAHDAAHEPSLGSVDFQNSCAPAVQAEFQRGVAMLHSYWFGYAGKTFRSVLEKDPGCAMAYWGMALDLLGNSLSVRRRGRTPTRRGRSSRTRGPCRSRPSASGRG